MDPAAPLTVSAALLTEWHGRFGRALPAFFRRRGVDAGDCDDLTQEVFARLAQRSDLGDVRFAERYLHRVAANVLSDWHRARKARGAGRHEPIENVPDLSDDSASQERVTLGRDALAHLRAALARMPERTQRVFALHHFEGLSYAEVAGRCGIAVRTVEDHMARANLFLLAALEDAE